ncbi:TetR/AcrR family transcriptional regulator [Actinomadura rugatobispora]|uniref:TetR/AcrR family transcriptional regulator n=1 Tax=Actinomadura rugatobispora TaxID=1994 RepID=A0ABW1A2V5_9ACTN|nr:helix-turn-helix domain-containing protein [Actinomadura rugatobispora]
MAKNPAEQVARRPLTRDLIVGAAITIIERDGSRALSMRKIAAELDVGVMTLYNHVPNKGALLEAVAETVLADLDVPASATGPDRDWKLNARTLVAAFRATARRYPRTMYLVLTSRVSAKSARRATRRILALLATAGFDDETSVRALRALMAYMMGAQILQDGAVTMSHGLPGDPADPRVDLDPAETPHVAALFEELTRPDPEAEFELGLEMLLAALDRLPRGDG